MTNIEQEAERVTRSMTAEDFVAAERDVESRVFARAVRMLLKCRSMLNRHKTVVISSWKSPGSRRFSDFAADLPSLPSETEVLGVHLQILIEFRV